MAVGVGEEKIKLTINKDTLLIDQDEDYLLTKVPGANKYILFDKTDTYEDNNTFVVSVDPNKTYEVFNQRVDLMRAAMGDSTGNFSEKVTGDVLYESNYDYAVNLDPKNVKAREIAEANKRIAAEAKKSRSAKTIPEAIVTKREAEVRPAQKAEANIEAAKAKTRENIKDRETVNTKRTLTYTKEQFEQIRKAVRQKLDAKQLSSIQLNPNQMKELRLGLKAGIDVSKYNSEFISAEQMKEIRLGHAHGVGLDINKLDHTKYNAAQTKEIRLAFESKLNVSKIINPNFNAAQMREIRLGERIGLDTSSYALGYCTAEQMNKMRFTLTTQLIADKIKAMFHDIRNILSEVTNRGMQAIVDRMNVNYNKYKSMTPEQIMDSKINDVVEDIKDILVQAELVEEDLFENENISNEMGNKLKNTVEEILYSDKPLSEEVIENKISDTSLDMVQTAAPNLSNNVINVNFIDQKRLEESIMEELDYQEQQELAGQELDAGLEMEM